jgi:hypothetical protein
MTSLPAVPRLDQCDTIARLIHTTATAVYRQHPQLLSETGRQWLRSGAAEVQAAQLAAQLAHQTNADTLRRTVEEVLAQIFVPTFQTTKAHGQVLQRVQRILTTDPPPVAPASPVSTPSPEPQPVAQIQPSPQSEPQPDPFPPVAAPASPPPPPADLSLSAAPKAPPEVAPSVSTVTPAASFQIDPNAPWSGLLLVDAENMHPPAALEAHLQALAQYPIRYRLAFGNWRTLGNRDQEFYRRGYQMIHVPSRKNSADIKMSLDASLISLHHPSIREVFICSADTDLLHLGHTLLRQGMIPYQVSHDSQGFKVFNLATQTQQRLSLPTAIPGKIAPGIAQPSSPDPTPHVPSSLTQMKSWLRILILQEQQAHPNQPVTIGRLGALFRERNHISPNQVLQTYGDVTTLKQLLEADPSFVLTPLDATNVQVALHAPTLERPLSVGPTPFPGPITNVQTLEQAVLAVLAGLVTQPGGTVSLTVLGSAFAQVYQQPMSQALKQIGEPKKLPTFLAKCSSLRLERKGENWYVGLAIPG